MSAVSARMFRAAWPLAIAIGAIAASDACAEAPARVRLALTQAAPSPAPRARPLAPAARIANYRPVYQACRDGAGRSRLALRTMTGPSGPLLLTIDPQTLATAIEPAARWTCADTTDDAQRETRFGRALAAAAPAAASPALLRNEGLTHGAGEGAFVTGDLCPSGRPLDRAFLDGLAAEAPGVPIALSITGLWLLRHAEDFRWLQARAREGALAITWVNHSFHHPYLRRRPASVNFLLTPGVDLVAEALETERLLIAQGEAPSAFFRFPGLVTDGAQIEALRRLHLIALGADAWLVLSPPPRPGSIVLVHPNGNEPAGLRLFMRYLDEGRLPRPFRPIADAPAP